MGARGVPTLQAFSLIRYGSTDIPLKEWRMFNKLREGERFKSSTVNAVANQTV